MFSWGELWHRDMSCCRGVQTLNNQSVSLHWLLIVRLIHTLSSAPFGGSHLVVRVAPTVNL